MQVQKRDGKVERQVLTGMVVSRTVLGPIAARWEKGFFGSRWANLVGGWCVEHYRKYQKAPGATIQGYFDRWAESGKDKDTVQLVDGFLAGLSDEYARLKKEVSPNYILDQCGWLFDRVRLTDLKERVEGHLESGEVEEAKALVEGFRPVQIGTGAGISVLSDEEAIMTAFDAERISEVLIELPAALGNFYQTALCRDSLIGFMGKEKVGKSFFLQDLTIRAVEAHRNVAYFEVGDSSQDQVLRRFASRVSGRPVKAGKYKVPVDLEPAGRQNHKLPEVRFEDQVAEADMTQKEALTIMRRLGQRVGEGRLMLSCHPNSSINVRGIEAIIEGWERDGWQPDVIVVDYADILAPMDGRAETRDQINATWKALRALSQKKRCLVLTATQTDADSYDARTLRRTHFSEDKRKYAHVNGMVGINQTAAEADAQLYRLNWIVLRELPYTESVCVWLANCLAVSNPAVLSTF